MFNRITRLALVLVFCISLAVPALAAEPIAKISIRIPGSDAVFTLENVGSEYVVYEDTVVPHYRFSFPGNVGTLVCDSAAHIGYAGFSETGFGGSAEDILKSAGWREGYGDSKGKEIWIVDVDVYDDGTLVYGDSKQIIASVDFFFGYAITDYDDFEWPEDLISWEWDEWDTDRTDWENYEPTHRDRVDLPKKPLSELAIEVTAKGTPKAAIDYETEALTGLSADETYTVNGNLVTLTNGVLPINSTWFGTSIDIISKGNGTTTSDSPAQSLSIPARPAAPQEVGKTDTTNGNANGTLTGVSPGLMYKLSTANTWKNGVESGIISNLTAGTYLVREPTVPGVKFASEAVELVIASSTAPGGGGTTTGGGTTGGTTSTGSGGESTTTTTPPAATETETVTALPEQTVTASAPTQAQTAAAETAVAAVADKAAATSGASILAVAPPVTVSTGTTAPTVTTITLPEGVPANEITTLAVVNEDGTLTPVPARINEDGTVTALVSGGVTLVPLHVEPSFTDTDFGAAYTNVTDEINQAAAMMIVEGRGNGVFDPSAQVTAQESVTMFLRAIGVPVDYSTAMTTGAAHGLNTAAAIPTAPMTRIATATLLVNALEDVGMKPSMTAAEADTVLASFYDLATLTEQEKIDLAICVKLGIFKGYGGSRAGEIGPNELLQRSHMASLSVRLQDVILGR